MNIEKLLKDSLKVTISLQTQAVKEDYGKTLGEFVKSLREMKFTNTEIVDILADQRQMILDLYAEEMRRI